MLGPSGPVEIGDCKPSQGGVLIRVEIPNAHCVRASLGVRSPSPYGTSRTGD